MEPTDAASLKNGEALIRRFVRDLPDAPGVYRMLDAHENVLYVGKAKSLKKRVASYTHIGKLPIRLQRMVAATRDMAFVTTHTESEALLLEANLIKKLKPHYNILLRDDKSFPYIFITGDHDFPLLTKHRGAQKRKGDYFGPFASAGAVNRTIAALQKAFMLRNCSDNVFAQRTRPCLQYQIKRCTAPCVDLCSKDDYARQVEQARAFLSGKSGEVRDALAREMQDASAALDFETAARLRDRIKALTAIQSQQDINSAAITDADIIALAVKDGKACIQVFFFRGGQNFGNRAYFPRHTGEESAEDILSAFLPQFYDSRPAPRTLLLSHAPDQKILIEEALETKITLPQRGEKKRLIDFAARNAAEALDREQAKLASEKKHLESLAALFDMATPPQRIEIYDNSHISGTNMVGAMVVAGSEGLDKKAYRKFNIREAAASDDYGMMREVMTRRFKQYLKAKTCHSDPRESGAEESQRGKQARSFANAQDDNQDFPDLLLIDGGKGQLSAVNDIMDEITLPKPLTIVSIAKGPDRNAGREQFFMTGRAPFQLPIDDPTLHYLQRLRDEAHRFAISAHRTRRTKALSASPLDDIPGIGAKRKKALLLHFGSAKAVENAGINDLAQIDGISKAVAEKIYGWFHEKN